MNKLFCTIAMSAVSIALCLSITACDKKPVAADANNNASTPEMPISEMVLKELIKKEYAGRLVGTEGNEKAVKYLADYMKEIGIKPFSDGDYTMNYTQITGDPNKQNTKVVVTLKDGSTKELVHGKDFYTNAASKPINIDIPLEFNPDKATLQTIPVIESKDIIKIKEPGEVYFFWKETTQLVVGTPETGNTFCISISKELRDELEKSGAVSAKVTADCVPVNSFPDNVVGIIKGKPDTEKVVVLTAHMDHVGEQGDFLFSGVIDNASGTSALISTAAKLKALTKDKVLDYDIVIAAVNSEETRGDMLTLLGSKKVAEVLSKNYTNVQNINIDCVGTKTRPELNMGITKNKNQPIMQSFRDKLTSSNIAFNEDKYGSSDHLSFEEMGYPAFTIGGVSEYLELNLHTANSTADVIDFDYLEKLSQAIAEFVVDADPLFTQAAPAQVDVGQGSEEWDKLAKTEVDKILNGKKLAHNEQIYFEFGAEIIQMSSNERLTSLEEVAKYYPTMGLPKAIAGYKFDSIEIQSTEKISSQVIPRDKIPAGVNLNEVVKFETNLEDISYCFIRYTNKKSYLEFIAHKIYDGMRGNDEFNQVRLTLTEPTYEQFTLQSMDEGKTYYMIEYEKDGYRICVSTRDIKTFSPAELSKEEMTKRIDEFGLK